MLRILRRFAVLVAAVLLPFYAISLTETLAIPSAWRAIDIGDDHAQVRTRLRDSGLADRQCEWLGRDAMVRCTLVGRHHAAGVLIRFDGDSDAARVIGVEIREPVYTGPFHLHARLRRTARQRPDD